MTDKRIIDSASLRPASEESSPTEVARVADTEWMDALTERIAGPYCDAYAKAGDLTLWSQRDFDVANAAHSAVIATMLRISNGLATREQTQDGTTSDAARGSEADADNPESVTQNPGPGEQ